MNASWVKDSTATTGTGTMTLDGTPDSGFLGFDDVFSTGDVVHYTIEDGNNRENGIGTLTSGASWTLSRDQIFETLISGSYSRWPATGISLSGSATVGIAPSANTVMDGFKPYIATSDHLAIPDSWIAMNATAMTATADRMYIVPFLLFTTRKITHIRMRVTTLDAGETVGKAGIYDSDKDGKANALLASVSIDGTTTGSKEVALGTAIVLPPGLYHAAYASNAAPGVSGRTAGSGPVSGVGIPVAESNFAINTAYKTLSAWSDLPDPCGAYTDEAYVSALPTIGFNYD